MVVGASQPLIVSTRLGSIEMPSPDSWVELELPQSLKHCTYVPSVICLVLGIDQDIIQVHDAADICQSCQGLIDEGLKRGWGVRQPKRQHCVLKVAVRNAVFQISSGLMPIRL